MAFTQDDVNVYIIEIIEAAIRQVAASTAKRF
jgi:hypothetical protein